MNDTLRNFLGQLSITLIWWACIAIFISLLVFGIRWLGIGLKREHPLIVLGGVLCLVLFIVIICFWSGCFA